MTHPPLAPVFTAPPAQAPGLCVAGHLLAAHPAEWPCWAATFPHLVGTLPQDRPQQPQQQPQQGLAHVGEVVQAVAQQLGATPVHVPPQAFDLGAVAAQALEQQAPPAAQPVAEVPQLATLEADLDKLLDRAGDRWRRPLIKPRLDELDAYNAAVLERNEKIKAGTPPTELPPEPKAPTAKRYTRSSTLGKVLEEQSALGKWQQRMTLTGAALKPHIMLNVSQNLGDKDRLNALAEEAFVASGANDRREAGTGLHKLTENYDRGLDLGHFPPQYLTDLEAYKRVTAGWVYTDIEVFVVNDQLETAGTFDRLRLVLPPKRSRRKPKLRIVDLKTGASADFGQLGWAVQLAVYATGERYDAVTGERRPLGVVLEGPHAGEYEVDLDVAEVVHLPLGEGRAQVYEVDIRSGRTAAGLAKSVKALRNDARKWVTPASHTAEPYEPDLSDLIAAAPSVEALTALWGARSSEFTPELVQLAGARHTVLAGQVAS